MRLIDADKLFDALEADKANLIQSGYNADKISGLNMALCSINIAPPLKPPRSTTIRAGFAPGLTLAVLKRKLTNTAQEL